MAGEGFYKRIFGVGPVGVLLSAVLFILAFALDQWAGPWPIFAPASWQLYTALGLTILTLGLHGWCSKTLSNWWAGGRLCTGGPFRFVRHPLYAAWIDVFPLAMILFMNSWAYVGWWVGLHLLWHLLVPREECMMRAHFGGEYEQYAARTGRFVPRLKG